MKAVVKVFCAGLVVAVLAGCASKSAYIPTIPAKVQAQLIEYFEHPDNKVFILAVDPGGNYAFGYDFGKASVKEAAEAAVEQCDSNRKAYGIIAKPYIYAINNDVVYADMINAASGQKDSRQAQKEEFQELTAAGDASEEGAAPAEEVSEEVAPEDEAPAEEVSEEGTAE